MLFTPIYIAMTFIKTWRIRSFRSRLLEFLSGNTSVAFCKVPENAAETPTLSSKLCTNPKNAYLCDLLDYTNASRICSMKPTQCIDIGDWVSCSGGLPLGSSDASSVTDVDIEVLFECEMDPHEESSYYDIISLDSLGQPIAWKAGSHLAIVLKTNIEHLSIVGFHFVGGEFIIDQKLPVVRIQTVQLSGEPNKATDLSMRGLRSDIQNGLKLPSEEFQWPIHASLLRKLSRVVDSKSDRNVPRMNGSMDNCNGHVDTTIGRRNVTLTDVSTITTKSLSAEEDDFPDKNIEAEHKTEEISPQKKSEHHEESNGNLVVENVTVEIQHNITPKKSSLRLDLKKGTSNLSTSLLNISSQIKSVTTHKRIVSTSGPKKAPETKSCTHLKEENEKSSPSQMTPKSLKGSRPLVNTKSPNILIYSDSVVARDNLEASLKKVLDCNRYTVYSVSREALCGGAWRGRAALVAVAGCSGRAAPLLLAHLLDGGRLLALCSDLLHTVLPHYKTAEIRENEVVQFSYDKWKSVKMKHHIFCYQASPAKKQFSTESDRQPSRYSGHPGHELDIQVLASEETWRTPSLLQATDLTNHGVAIFSQIHLESDPTDYLGEEGIKSNEARLEILHKILGDILGLHVKDPKELVQIDYTRGFFLGDHVHKLSLVEGWCPSKEGKRVQKIGNLTLQWCMRGEEPVDKPSESFLPVYLYECPENFSTVDYFDNLTSACVGRVLVYADMLTSTQHVVEGVLGHGVGAVARGQSAGRGRGHNQWISPSGQAVMSLQLPINNLLNNMIWRKKRVAESFLPVPPMRSTPLFRQLAVNIWQKMSPTIPLVQHATALAVVRAVRSDPTYGNLDIRIKWPNDIYYGRNMKIGGIITTANCIADDVIINIGTGVNISNSVPTTCVNDIITEYNTRHGTSLESISIEKFLARYCSQLEEILDNLNSEGGVEAFLKQYYEYWLHDGEEIHIQTNDEGSPVPGTISGLDEFGWLLVRTSLGDVRVQPDGNTFDIMSGLIAPKI